MITVADFRTNFPEFANSTKYPNAQIQFYLDLGLKLLTSERWVVSELQDYALQLFVAHQITLAAQRARAAATGGAPGVAGVVASKAVDKVSVSYDTAASLVKDAGHWNLTSYGLQFIDLVRTIGSGGIQL